MDPWVVLLTGALIILAVWLSWGRSLMSPDGVTVFISGCDSGIGKQLAVYFAEMGCHVFAGCLDPRAAMLSLPDTVRTIHLDITDEECVRQAISTIQNVLEEEKKELWALVNNAGVCVYGLFEWQTPQQRDRQVQVNLLGTMRLTKACLPLLQKSKVKGHTTTGARNFDQKSSARPDSSSAWKSLHSGRFLVCNVSFRQLKIFEE
ncbi:d-beta-hydroxybutyrate dehydrogenase, mitochondrial [Trichonephila clavipes]|nr:d-beta-hydroxybutyrate dehydrogenase, mitochondrial [Trichonephila clavipes]